jgi:hypothetical protein
MMSLYSCSAFRGSELATFCASRSLAESPWAIFGWFRRCSVVRMGVQMGKGWLRFRRSGIQRRAFSLSLAASQVAANATGSLEVPAEK